MNFRKYIQITSVLTVFFALVFIKHALGGDQEAANAIIPNSTAAASTPLSTLSNSTLATATPHASQYKDGTFTGAVADALYGNVQVRVVVAGGAITQVTFLQYPNDQRTSEVINQQAMPILQSEAIAAQSEKVSGVSGASQTSDAFMQSMGSALTQSRA